jgi:hypothetical protein
MQLLAMILGPEGEVKLLQAIQQLQDRAPSAGRLLADMGEYLDMAAEYPDEVASKRHAMVLKACSRFISANMGHPAIASMAECCWAFNDMYQASLGAQEADFSEDESAPSTAEFTLRPPPFYGIGREKACGEMPQASRINQFQQKQELALSL